MYDERYQAADAARKANRPFVVFQCPDGRWDYRDATTDETHPSSECKARGLFGAKCPRCDDFGGPATKPINVRVGDRVIFLEAAKGLLPGCHYAVSDVGTDYAVVSQELDYGGDVAIFRHYIYAADEGTVWKRLPRYRWA